MADRFGYTPDQTKRLTWRQVDMLLDTGDADPNDRPDDWSQFGLRREGNHLYGSDEALDKYMAYRQRLEDQDA